MIVAPISVIAMIHNREGERLRRMVHSLRCQTVQPRDIIIVDTSFGADMAASVRRSLGEPRAGLPQVKHTLRPQRTFNKSFALNIGIRKSKQKYVLITDADFMFGIKLIEYVMIELEKGNTFVLAEAGYLPDIDLDDGLMNWVKLCSMIHTPERKTSPGTIQAVSREWMNKVRGYDERFHDGLGGMDDDMKVRANKDGLRLVWLPFREVQCLHQWHERSDMKGKCSHLFSVDPPIVKNKDGWGGNA